MPSACPLRLPVLQWGNPASQLQGAGLKEYCGAQDPWQTPGRGGSPGHPLGIKQAGISWGIGGCRLPVWLQGQAGE
jgi:hypothetical protein